jgi:glycosyltransferase involved in cell wall biosynthesis
MKYLANAITVVIPLYNKKSHIVETVKAVLAQTFPPYEIIVVNDGSTDGGEQALAECNFPNVQIINKRNAGVSAARNTGIEASRTEFVALLDADDQWRPHFLEEIYFLSRDFPEAGVYSTAYQYKKSQDSFSNPRLSAKHCPTRPGLLTQFFAMMADGDLPLTMSSIVIRHTLFDRIGGFPVGETMGEDQDFLFRAALAKPIAYSPKVLALYILNSDNRACEANLPQEECAFSKRISTMAELPCLSRDIKLQLKKCSAAHLLHLAKRNIQAGKLDNVKGFLADPRCALKPSHRAYWYTRYLLSATWQHGVQRSLNWAWALTKPAGESLRL